MDPARLGRRRFDHLFAEASVAAGRRLPRFALWMACHEAGLDPEALTREGALRFCRGDLAGFLACEGLRLAPREERRLLREIERFDPSRPTPYERFAALGLP
jgi:hypothetical protein